MQEDPTDEVERFLARYDPEVQALARRLRDVVFQVAPEAIEQVDLTARMLAYGFARTYRDTVCVIIPQREGVNLGFPRGVDLPDPAGLLRGEGKKTRYTRIYTPADASRSAVRALVAESVRLLRVGR